MNVPGSRLPLVTAVLMGLLALFALRDFLRLGDALPWRTMDDFADFYCAGQVLDDGADPYTYEPLRSCEHAVNSGTSFRGRLFASNPAIAVPAPQPPYDFAPFMALARLPFAAARALDGAAIVTAIALAALALAGIGIPLALAAAALLLSTGYAELHTGQIVPFALFALAFCGLALHRGRDALAGALAALTAIEPTLGVPVLLATLLFVPRARIAAIVGALFLALLASALTGGRGLLEYATQVLPVHARSELHFPFQYSLTYALAYLGSPPVVAYAAGSLSYVLLLAVGLVVAPRAAGALGRRELLVFIPALCCVIGGPFLHQEELCFALPALLVLAVESRGPARVAAAVALCILALPAIAVWSYKQLFLAAIFVCAAILLQLRVGVRAGIATLLVVAAAIYALELHPPHLPVPHAPPRVYSASELVGEEWRDYTEARSTRDALWFAVKVPAWAALVTALVLAGLCAAPRNHSTSARI